MKYLKATGLIITIAFVGLIAFAACSKDKPTIDSSQTEDVRSCGAAEQDSLQNDSTYHGVTVNTDWGW